MLRILLANFLVQVLPVLLIAAGIILALKSPREATGRRYLGILLVSFPVGVFVYIVAGIAAAAIRGDGHFYSVPFGGYSVSDNFAIGASIVIWMILVFLILAGLLRPKR
jgi:hypothetical protein